MAEPCNYELTLPGSIPKKGQQATLQLQPQLKPGCRFGPATATGGFKVVGWGGGGTVTVEALEDEPKGTVTVTVQCEDCGPTNISLALPEDEISKLHRETIALKRAWLKEIDDVIKKAELAVANDETQAKAGLLPHNSSQEAADRERVMRLKREKIEMMEKLEDELKHH